MVRLKLTARVQYIEVHLLRGAMRAARSLSASRSAAQVVLAVDLHSANPFPKMCTRVLCVVAT